MAKIKRMTARTIVQANYWNRYTGLISIYNPDANKIKNARPNDTYVII